MPGGRPTKYPNARARGALEIRILDLARHGASLAQIAAEIGVPRTTVLTWARAHPEFQATLTRAKELDQAWWEEKARTSLTDPNFNASLWRKPVEARFPHKYTERRRVQWFAGVSYQVVSRRHLGS